MLGGTRASTYGSTAKSDLRHRARAHCFGISAHPRQGMDELFADGFVHAFQQLQRCGVNDREHEVDQVSSLVGDVHQELAPIVWMGLAAHQPAAFQRVEQRRDAAARLEQPFRDNRRRQWFAGALNDGQCLPCTRREIGECLSPPIRLCKAQGGGASEIQQNLARRPARTRELRLEVRRLAQRFRAGLSARVRPAARRGFHQSQHGAR
jgi:hypothetical protein